MSAAWDSFCVSLTEIFRSTAFRLACAFAGFFGATTLLLFAFIYWQTAGFETNRIEAVLMEDARSEAARPPDAVRRSVETRVINDFHHFTFAGVFTADGKRIAGDLDELPAGVPMDGKAHPGRIAPSNRHDSPAESVRVVEAPLSDGTILVIARYCEEVERLSHEVVAALELGLIPAMALSLLVGLFMSWRAQKRVKEVNVAAARIMRGHLRERLPIHGSSDDFDRLAISVNRMLDEIARLLDEVKATGDEIAHDLRTPLTRVRARLENAMRKPAGPGELEAVIERSIHGLDQSLAIITALLRIREIEAGRRRAGFCAVKLADVVAAVDDLYQPIAEDKTIRLSLDIATTATVFGDRDLLIEAVGNVVDNAIKFTPEGGSVSIELRQRQGHPLITVTDTGPGIPEDERDAVFLRFHRSTKAQHVPGIGLGLSLVAAIARLHDIRIALGGRPPGCTVELCFYGISLPATEHRRAEV
jgi:signal transduction histidine kinase